MRLRKLCVLSYNAFSYGAFSYGELKPCKSQYMIIQIEIKIDSFYIDYRVQTINKDKPYGLI